MANKQINELSTSSGTLQDNDYFLVYDSSETGSEKTKKRPVSDYINIINSPTEFYVATTGSDITGDGSSGSPWATIQHALDWIGGCFINEQTAAGININLADGTYSVSSNITSRIPTTRVTIKGNTTTPSNVTLNFPSGQNGITCYGAGAMLWLNGLKVVGFSSAEGKVGVQAAWGAAIYMANGIIDGWGNGFFVYQGGHAMVGATSTINNCYNGLIAGSTSHLYTAGSVTISNNTYGAYSMEASEIVTTGATYSSNSNNTGTASNGRVTVA